MNIEDADLILQKVGTIAIMYYSDLPADSPEYRLSDDIDWCLEGVGEMDSLAEIRESVGRAIVDPTRHREALTELIYGLVPNAVEADG